MSSATTAIPSGIDDVDPQWLTEVLRAHHSIPRSASVTGLRAEQIALDTGFSSLLYRLHLTGADVPPTVIVKLPATSEARGAMEMMGGYTREVAFYQHVAERSPMSTANVYAARIAEGSADFVLVLEDLRSWHNADHLAGLSLEQARHAITELAKLHAWSGDPANADIVQLFPSIDTPIMRDMLPSVFSLGWEVYRERTQQPIPDSMTDYAAHFAEHAPAALRALGERSSLLHGDIRADNMFFSGGELKIVDFQMAGRGAGAADIAYLVSQGLPTELRAGRDEELVGEYLALLSQNGSHDYTFEDAWRHYRFATAYLVVLPVIILVGWDALPQRSRDLCITLADRAVATIDEIDAAAVFG